MTRRLLAAFVSLIVLPVGCADEPPAPSGCKEGNTIGDVCAGVPNDPVCEEEYCTEGVACASIIEVNSGAAFGEAVGRAQAGTCIALATGSYGAVLLPQGVSLLGKGADFVTIAGIETGGPAVTVRGVSITSGSLTVRDGDTTFLMSRIVDSLEDGVTAGASSSVTIDASEIRNAKRYGISAFDVSGLSINNSIIHGKESGGGPGVWAQCSGGCACTGSTNVSLTNVSLVGNQVVGLSLVGAVASLHNVEVKHTTVGSNFEAGGGISASGCSEVTATQVSIIDNADFGMLVDDSSLDVDGLKVTGNLRGLWLQKIGLSMPGTKAVVRNGELTGNLGIGVGVAEVSVGVEILDTTVSETKTIALPVLVNGVSAGAQNVGDGITWKDESTVLLGNVTVMSSDRASVLIDGGVGSGSSIANAVISGGQYGILQQNFDATMGDIQPTLTASPPIEVSMVEILGVPDNIAIPPTI